MNSQTVTQKALPVSGVDLNELRQAIQSEYELPLPFFVVLAKR